MIKSNNSTIEHDFQSGQSLREKHRSKFPVRASLTFTREAKILAERAVRDGIIGRRTASLRRVVSSFEHLCTALEHLACSEVEVRP